MSAYVSVIFAAEDDPQVMPTYAYKTHIPDLRVGEWIVVPVNDRFGVGRVTTIRPGKKEISKATKWIVGRVDFETYNALTALDPPPEAETKKTVMASAGAQIVRQMKIITALKKAKW